MTDKNRMPLRELTVIGLACLAVVACSPKQGELGDKFFPHAKWEQIPHSVDNMVEVVTLRHTVAFTGGERGLGTSESDALNDFIRSNRINARDEILVQAGSGDSSREAMSRVAAIKSEFARRGLVASESAPATGAGAPASNEVAVLITRAVVIPPDCAVAQPEPTLRPEHTWGCSVNAALGMMVANPLDLVEGREMGPADSAQASGAVQRYRNDKVKAINAEETTN
jgi:pilus assembly protein CpaD